MTDNSKPVNPNLSGTNSQPLSGSVNVANESVVPPQPSVQNQYPDPNLTTQMPQVPYKRPFNFIKIGFLVMVVALLLVGGYVGYKQYSLRQSNQSSSDSITPTVEPNSTPVDGSVSPTGTTDNATPVVVPQDGPFLEFVDFENCSPGDGYSRSVENGSTYLSIVDVDAANSICKVELLNESESGYTKYSCSIPRSIGIIGFNVSEQGSDFSEIINYCSRSQSLN